MPLPIEKLKAVKTIVTHKACADGVASAIFLHESLPQAEVRFVQYGHEQRALKPSHHMLICDFSPHPDEAQSFIDADALILDHHKGAQKLVEAFGANGVFADEVTDPTTCGAVLAYREVWQRLVDPAGQRVEFAARLAKLAGVRDTWQSKDPDWLEGCAVAEALKFHPEESWLIDKPFNESNKQWWDDRLNLGPMLFNRLLKTVYKAVETAYRFTTSRDTRVVMFSGVRLSSDAADMVDHDADLVVGFDYMGVEDGAASLVFSTRSHTGFNCMTFCKAQGGGGHTAAAGFSLKFDPKSATALDPYSTFERVLVGYEGTVAG